MPRQWQFPGRADAYPPPAAPPGAVLPGGFEAVAPVQAPVRRVPVGFVDTPLAKPAAVAPVAWYFQIQVPDRTAARRTTQYGQSDTPVALPSVPPAVPVFEIQAPVQFRKLPTQTGTSDYPLDRPPTSTAVNPVGWESQAPVSAKRVPAQPGFYEAPVNQPPAAIAANPVGWESQAPVSAKRIPTQPGVSETPLNQPPPSTAQRPLGWETQAPAFFRKRPTDLGLTDNPLRFFGADTANFPLGYFPEYPVTILRRKVTDRGWAYEAFPKPPSIPTQFVAGWLPLAPERARKLQTQPGDYVLALLALPQPVAPPGWWVLAPERFRKLQTQPGVADWPLFLIPAALAQNPLGWLPLAPERARRVLTQPGLSDWPAFRVPAAVAQNPIGWEAVSPWRVWTRRADAGWVGAALTPAALPSGFRVELPDRTSRRRQTDAGVITSGQAPALVAPAPPYGWPALAPPHYPPRRAPSGAFILGQTPIVAIPAPTVLAPESARRVPAQPGVYAASPWVPPVVYEPSGWRVEAPDRSPRRPTDPGWLTVFSPPPLLFITTNVIPLTASIDVTFRLLCQAGSIIPLVAEVVTVYRLRAELE